MFIIVSIRFTFLSTEHFSRTVHLKSSLSKINAYVVVCLKQLAFLHCSVPKDSSAWQIECHCWKYARVVDLSLETCSNITLEDVALLGECCPSGRDSSLNLLVLVFVSGAVSLSKVAFNILDLSVIDIYFGVSFPSFPLSSTCSSSGADFHFYQLIPVAFVVIHVMY